MRRSILLIVIPSLLLFGIDVFLNGGQMLQGCDKGGDLSLLLLGSEKAKSFSALLGPYSRYRFNHPGPIMFYWYGFIGWLGGAYLTPMGAATVAQVILNCAACIFAMVVLFKHSRLSTCAPLLLIALGLCFEITETPFLHFIWNPVAILFPAAALIVGLARWKDGDQSFSPVVVAVAWLILFHSHIVSAVFVSFLILLFLLDNLRPLSQSKSKIKGLFTFSLIVLAGMTPVLCEVLSSANWGNAGRILKHVRHAKHTGDPLDGIIAVLELFSLGWEAPLLGAANFLVLSVGIYLVPLKTSPFDRALRSILLIANIALLITAYFSGSDGHSYIYWFTYAVMAVELWFIASAILVELGARINNQSLGYIGAIGSIVFCVLIAPQSMLLGGECDLTGDQLVRALDAQGVTSKVRLEISGKDAWSFAATSATSLYRRKIPFCVQRKWSFMFGKDLACEPSERVSDTHLLVSTKDELPPGKVLVNNGKMKILQLESTSLESIGDDPEKIIPE